MTTHKLLHNSLRGEASWLTCELCSTAISLIRLYPSVSTTQTVFVQMCSSLGYEERHICSGIADLFGEEFVYILSNSKLSHTEICGLVIAPRCSSNNDYPYAPKWIIPLTKLNSTLKEMLINRQSEEEQSLNKNLAKANNSEILHLSDIHLDMYYQMNAYASCSEPLCCRTGSSHSSKSFHAGYWGSFGNCDTTIRTLESLISTVANDYADQYRYLLFTGDYIAHDVWNTSKQEIITTTRKLNKIFRQNIPEGKIVIPVIGNHEGFPVNQFCPPQLGIRRFSVQWLYEELLDQWKDWIPADMHETFRENGYYSLSDGPTRFIVLNMNYCARLNFWIAYDHIDLGDMLKWMESELQNALQWKQIVYIAGHIIPDNEECATHWTIAYNDIIEKYSNIIKGQFFGHTHMDEIRLYYSNFNRSKAIGVAYATPSVTTYGDVNPAFRLYNTNFLGTIVDHRTFYLNLTESNKEFKLASPMFTPQAKWQFEYSAREAFNMSSLSPQEWHRVMSTIKDNKKILDKYYQFYGRYSGEEVKMKPDAAKLELVTNRVFVRF
ncbi:hypothetical protein RDWZM_000002 [Blomia tropicalis]|uniref:Sphingomyelin phosphodiesterase n=1 Tax=Blomia tropicalis TaxID=40697 RepID=A0A9Q0MBE1_BLOTA|nr:hypothetical protein RDWZM_000002 [Blomia tropicalis]